MTTPPVDPQPEPDPSPDDTKIDPGLSTALDPTDTDNMPRPEDGDQSGVSQDPAVTYDDESSK